MSYFCSLQGTDDQVASGKGQGLDTEQDGTDQQGLEQDSTKQSLLSSTLEQSSYSDQSYVKCELPSALDDLESCHGTFKRAPSEYR